jgi:hypothetical protein
MAWSAGMPLIIPKGSIAECFLYSDFNFYLMITDAEKENFLKIFEDHFNTVDEQAQILLKGHLLIEEKLYDIISNFVFHQDALEKAKLGFYQKLHLARSLSLDESKNSMWELVLAVNSLRNKIAHKLAIEEREKPLEHLKALYKKEMADDELENVWDTQGTIVGLSYSISLILGFLSTFEKESLRFKEMINNLDLVLNTYKK